MATEYPGRWAAGMKFRAVVENGMTHAVARLQERPMCQTESSSAAMQGQAVFRSLDCEGCRRILDELHASHQVGVLYRVFYTVVAGSVAFIAYSWLQYG